MNRLLILSYCIVGCLFTCMAQERGLPSRNILQQLLLKATPDTADITALLAAGETYLLRPGCLRSDMDSAALFAEKVLKAGIAGKEPSWEARGHLLLSAIYREPGDTKRGKGYIRQAIAIFNRLHEKAGLADSYVELSNYYSADENSELREKIRYHQLAADLYAAAGMKRKQAQTLHTLGDYYTLVPDQKAARDVLLQALALYKETGFTSLQGVYDLLGVAYNQLGDHNNALKYALLSVRTAEAMKDSTGQLCATYNRLGMIYYDMGSAKESMTYYRKAWEVAVRLKDTVSIQILACNFAHSSIRLGTISEGLGLLKEVERRYPPKRMDTDIWLNSAILGCYVKSGRYEQGRPYAQHLEVLGKGVEKADPKLEHIHGPLIKYYLGIRQYAKARTYAAAMADMALKQGHLSVLASSYNGWFKADSALGLYADAIRHYQLYKKYNDSLFNITKSRQISQLQLQFDAEQKDQAIQLKQQNIELLTREGMLQKAELQKARVTRNVIIIGAGMLVMLLLLGYNRYQLKQRSNQQMKAQQQEINEQNVVLQHLIQSQHKLIEEKEWLLKEIHHRVKNNLQIVMSLLNTQAALLDDKDALNAIRESRSRMQTISLIHQKLYQSDDMALIDMRTYIHDLTVYLKDGFSGMARISFDLRIAPVKMDVSLAVPVGLILNEAINNAMKFAFSSSGTITVSLQQTGKDKMTLVVADNGKGLPEAPLPAGKRSMGMTLMQTLCEQLGGTLNIESRNGVIITVNFIYQEKQPVTGPVTQREGVPDYA
ncbi:tetratricopeptide repeat-containing sensor histidine kinase [Chitinophaga agri]|uniref:histidine kinase n=1 Tax=Chitinophaga agri TaxID=2703787 RepID=A0A6B9ZHZ8_9BACT|nr:histidine kinase dimerization/phosphoacceptor domain -containing protein [Chitinophaga agri]QHS61121.1 tetratricopeptide repeat protein [Chitinophaga agri]